MNRMLGLSTQLRLFSGLRDTQCNCALCKTEIAKRGTSDCSCQRQFLFALFLAPFLLPFEPNYHRETTMNAARLELIPPIGRDSVFGDFTLRRIDETTLLACKTSSRVSSCILADALDPATFRFVRKREANPDEALSRTSKISKPHIPTAGDTGYATKTNTNHSVAAVLTPKPTTAPLETETPLFTVPNYPAISRLGVPLSDLCDVCSERAPRMHVEVSNSVTLRKGHKTIEFDATFAQTWRDLSRFIVADGAHSRNKSFVHRMLL